ncbi:MAG: efflux RND transporter periplasmic adaptor subunit [Myxococcota bacterium]
MARPLLRLPYANRQRKAVRMSAEGAAASDATLKGAATVLPTVRGGLTNTAQTQQPHGPAPYNPRSIDIPDFKKITRARRRWALLSTAVLVLIVAIWWTLARGSAAPIFHTAPVTQQDVIRLVEVTGHLDVWARTDVHVPSAGIVIDVAAQPGRTVKRGELLAQLDSSAADLNLSGMHAAQRAAEAQVSIAKGRLDAAVSDLQRMELLAQRKLASEAALSTARAAATEAKAALQSAQAHQSLAMSEVAASRLVRNSTRIAAPIDGIVLRAPERLGGFVTPAQGPLFVIGSPLHTMRIDAMVGEVDIGSLRVGLNAVFDVPAYPSQRFTAQIERIEREPRKDNGAITYPVKFRTENPDGLLFPGMTASLRIEVARADNTLTVREAALRFVPEDAAPADPRTRVWKLIEDSRLEAIEVRPGLSDGAVTQVQPVVAETLTADDIIVIGYMRGTEESVGKGISLTGKGRRSE